MKQPAKVRRGPRFVQDGFSLVEVVIAIGVVALTFVGLIGLLGVGYNNVQTSSDQTVATNIAASIVSDLRSTPSYATIPVKSTRYGLILPTSTASSATTPLSGVTPYYLYFDNMQNVIGSPTSGPPSSVPSGATYVAFVYMVRIFSINGGSSVQSGDSDMVRVVVSWPPQSSTVSAGNVDVITQFSVR